MVAKRKERLSINILQNLYPLLLDIAFNRCYTKITIHKRKRLIDYTQNERQQKSSQNQYYQRLRIPDRRKERTGGKLNHRDRIHPESD